MKLLDNNIWLALVLSGHEHHRECRAWMDQQGGSVLFCRSTQQGMLRLLTTAAVLARYGNPPLANAEALEVYERLLDDDRIGFANEPQGMDGLWRNLAGVRTASPKLWMDAYLAAFAMTSDLELVTCDRAFRQFEPSGLRLTLLPP